MWELEDEDVVVRGGVFSDPVLILEAVEDAVAMGYGPVLSVFAGKVSSHHSVEDSVVSACIDGKVPHGKVRVARVGDLTGAGFRLVQDTSDGQPQCHFHVLFSAVPTSVEANRFIECFAEPIRNPAKEIAS